MFKNFPFIYTAFALLILSALAAPGLQADRYSDQSGMNTEAVLYYHPNCSHCTKVKAYLKNKNRTLTMKNTAEPRNQRELQAMGQRGVPVLVVGNRVIVGSNSIISYLNSHPEVLQ